jgi:hypothetical protein
VFAGARRSDPIEELPRAADQHHQDPESRRRTHSSERTSPAATEDRWEPAAPHGAGARPLRNLARQPSTLK